MWSICRHETSCRPHPFGAEDAPQGGAWGWVGTTPRPMFRAEDGPAFAITKQIWCEDESKRCLGPRLGPASAQFPAASHTG